MQFLWKYIDELVGKGLEWDIVAELLFYASANLVPMALPLAILLSSIMTFGNLGENYELVALKAAGISLQRIMFPLVIVTIITSLAAFYFSNNVWPVANLKMATILYDVRQKKPTLDIKEKVFYKGIDKFVIRIGKKDQDGQTIHDVSIYDHTQYLGNVKVVRSESGKMQLTSDKRWLLLTLYNGTSYEEMKVTQPDKQDYPHFRTKFKEYVMRFDLTNFGLNRTNEDLFKDHYQMLNIVQLREAIDTLNAQFVRRKYDHSKELSSCFIYNRDSAELPVLNPDSTYADMAGFDTLPVSFKREIFDISAEKLRSAKSYTSAIYSEMDARAEMINRHSIEWHRKFTLSIACIVLFFIGAPLGAIIRKGGLGMPVVVSTIFFMIFHVLSITGEKLVKEQQLEPFQGMWLATLCLLPVGIFLTYKSTTDSPILEIGTYTKLLRWSGGLLNRRKKVISIQSMQKQNTD